MEPINRRSFMQNMAGGFIAAGALNATAERLSEVPSRPNLVFLLADQLGRNHCGFSGTREARTPTIDRLAGEGVEFRNAVSTMPVCSAYRASLLTGRYPTSTGMVINELRFNPNQECLGHLLTQAGYDTGYIGKWHLYANQLGNHHDPRNSFVPPGPHRLGFDGYWAAYNFHHNYYGAYYHRDSAEKVFFDKEVYEPDGQTDLALNFIKEAKGNTKPFALFLSFGTPHDPWHTENVPENFLEPFKDVPFPNPPNYQEENDPYSDAWGRFKIDERNRLEQWRRVYYGMTANLDWNIRRILDTLDASGQRDNTLVVFTSDHGEMFGAHGRRAKNIFYDEAARVPFVMNHPGIIQGDTVTDACLGTVDILPTLLGLLGLSIPEGVEGTDLSAAAMGMACSQPEAALLQNTGACAAWENGHEWRAARDKRYTYARYRRDGREFLFDNNEDPCQLNDLASEKRYEETLERLRSFTRAKMAAINDTNEECTWYRDHWTENRCIIAAARGHFEVLKHRSSL